MEYLAHISEERKQSVKEHLLGTAKLAGTFAERFGKEDWGYFCGMLHDIGKYSCAFQDKILSDSNKMVDHSTAGAKVCWEKGGIYPFMSYCIAGHHAGLPDYGSSSDSGSSPTMEGRKKKRVEDYSAYKKEIEIPEIKTPPVDSIKIPDLDFSLSVLIRMLYSCLVDTVFVLDLKVLERNMGFSALIQRTATETVETIEKLDILDDIEVLRDTLEDLSFARKLSKVKKTSAIFKLGIKKETIIEFTKTTPALAGKFKYSEDGAKIRLDTKKSKLEFLKLLNDAFLHSELTKQYYEASAKDNITQNVE